MATTSLSGMNVPTFHVVCTGNTVLIICHAYRGRGSKQCKIRILLRYMHKPSDRSLVRTCSEALGLPLEAAPSHELRRSMCSTSPILDTAPANFFPDPLKRHPTPCFALQPNVHHPNTLPIHNPNAAAPTQQSRTSCPVPAYKPRCPPPDSPCRGILTPARRMIG